MHQPLRESGQAAVRLLADALDHAQSPANASVPTHLVIRDSWGLHGPDGTPLPPPRHSASE
ncbi:hypothetical protein [Streptomyces sp. NPDC060322]|uniref:hypothetical protein n=1 Tax=Streptomyces sp. NPDC060322 TaxID=3347097 RepID=UPI003647343E